MMIDTKCDNMAHPMTKQIFILIYLVIRGYVIFLLWYANCLIKLEIS